MRRYRLLTLVLVGCAVLATIGPTQALAFEQRTGNNIVVSEPVSDDLFLFGSTIEVPADVDGDVFAFGQSVSITGDVSGTIVAAGQTVRVSGAVDGSVRAAGQDVEIDGTVLKDAMLSGATLKVTQDGSVGRDILLGGQNAVLSGAIGRDVRAGANSMTIASTVGRDVHAAVQDLTVTSGATIGGDLDYTSSQQADVQGQVTGQTTRHEPRARNTGPTVNPAVTAFFSVLGWIRSLIGILLFGVAIVLLGRGATQVASDTLMTRPWLSLGIGAAVLFGVWPLAGVVFGLGLLIGGWWISLALLATVWLLALVGVIVGGLAFGRLLLRWMHTEWHPLWAMILGILAIWIVGAIPFVGWLPGFAAVLFGTGATTLALFGHASSMRHPAEQVPTMMQPAQPPYAPPPPQYPPSQPPYSPPPAPYPPQDAMPPGAVPPSQPQPAAPPTEPPPMQP